MKTVIFKSSIIYSFITVMIVIFLLTVICDLKYINDKKTEVNESMKYEDQLNMFLSNLRSKGEYKYVGKSLTCLCNIFLQKLERSKNLLTWMLESSQIQMQKLHSSNFYLSHYKVSAGNIIFMLYLLS